MLVAPIPTRRAASWVVIHVGERGTTDSASVSRA